MTPVPSTTPREVAERLRRGERLTILDVREPFELALARLAGTLDIPMHDVPRRLAEVPRDGEVVVMCHHGHRSAVVAKWLRDQGVPAVNLAGGIARWADEVDDSVGRY